jgi:ubiquinone/menaquinone biosynthesis C-methylase UbiE
MTHRLLEAFMRFFFKQLYTSAAWAYDFVAWTSSMGQWRSWQRAALVDYNPGRLLEIGHGPGHLMLDFIASGHEIIGIDASRQMTRMASRRLLEGGVGGVIIQGRSQELPLESCSISGVIATFPAEFILEPDTLNSIFRTLIPGGKCVIIGLSTITGKAFYDRFASWLYRFTGQSDHPEEAYDAWLQQLEKAGFETQQEIVKLPRANVLRLTATKKELGYT